MRSKEMPLKKDLDWLEDFSLNIGFNQETIKKITDIYKSDYLQIHKLYKKSFTPASCHKIVFIQRLLRGRKAYLYLLAAVLLKAQDTLSLYRQRNIDEAIFYDTMKDILVWTQNLEKDKGCLGVENIHWLQNHLNCTLFKLGRLQFQHITFSFPAYADKEKKERVNHKIGEKALFVHIPQGEKLIKEECIKSLDKAEQFFTDYPFKVFICASWLLYEGNKDFMKQDSNIMRFAELFNIIGSTDKTSQAEERIFGKEEKDPSLYPENTSLQRQCKAYLLSGKKTGTGFGIIERKASHKE